MSKKAAQLAPLIMFELPVSLRQAEHKIICETLLINNGNRSRAAGMLGIHERTVGRKLAEMPNEKRCELRAAILVKQARA